MFLDLPTWLKPNKACIELTFSMFFEGSSFKSIFGPHLDLVLKPFPDDISAKMPTEGAKRRSKGAWRGGPFLSSIFEPRFDSNVGLKNKGAFSM